MRSVKGLGTTLDLFKNKMAENSRSDDYFMNWQENRSNVREKSTKSRYLRSSLQTLTKNDDVLLMLDCLVRETKTRY